MPNLAMHNNASSEIRWLAAEALIALRERAVAPLLLALKKYFKSVWLRQGAHVLPFIVTRSRSSLYRLTMVLITPMPRK